jgi:hypothetical protein
MLLILTAIPLIPDFFEDFLWPSYGQNPYVVVQDVNLAIDLNASVHKSLDVAGF